MMARRAVAVVASLGLVACTVENPGYCTIDGMDPGCPRDRPFCDIVRQSCQPIPDGKRPCIGSADCADQSAVLCSHRHLCEVCSQDAECRQTNPATPRCHQGTCVECLSAADCRVAAPACETSDAATRWTCRRCRRHGECQSLLCLDDGTCATDALYVDQQRCPGDGTLSRPFCQVQEAIDARPGQRVRIHVAASPRAYLRFTGNDIQAEVYADPRGAVGVDGYGEPAIRLSGGLLLVDGFQIDSYLAEGTVLCERRGMLTLRRSRIGAITGSGVVANDCNVTLSGDRLDKCKVSALSLVGSGYDVHNCFITGNPGDGSVVVFGAGSAGKFRWNTLVHNTARYPASVLRCDVKTFVEHSILWENFVGAGTPYGGDCNFSDSNLEFPPPGADNTALPPEFASADPLDGHLAKGSTQNRSCCVDTWNGETIMSDFDGDRRPLGAGVDRGADEVE